MIRAQAMTIDCPDGWQDKSMLILSSAAGQSGLPASFVLTCETDLGDIPLDPAGRLAAFADRQADQMRDTLPAPVEITRRQPDVPGAPPELYVDWVSGGIPIRQWITYANGPDGSIMIATGTAPQADYATAEPTFRTMLRSVRIA